MCVCVGVCTHKLTSATPPVMLVTAPLILGFATLARDTESKLYVLGEAVAHYEDMAPVRDLTPQAFTTESPQAGYTCTGWGYKCLDHLFDNSTWLSAERELEKACTANPSCKAYDFSPTLEIGHLCATSTNFSSPTFRVCGSDAQLPGLYNLF